MKRYKSILIFAALLFAGFAPQANAEEITPKFSISVDPDKSEVHFFDVYHGETVLFEVTFKRPSNETMTFFWQEQGMGDSYWSESCTTVGDGVYRAAFTPQMDTGAKVFNCFIGRPGMIYRAVFQLRMKQSPGATPGALPLPVKTIDFAEVEVKNAPWASATIVHEVSAAADNAIMTATNALAKANAAQSSAAAAQRSADAAQTSADNAQTVAADAKSAATAAADDVEKLNIGYTRLYNFSVGATNANFIATNYPLTKAEAEGRTHYDPNDPDLDFSTVPASMRLDEKRDGEKRTVVDTRDWPVWYFGCKLPRILAAAQEYAHTAYTNALAHLSAWADRTARGLENPAGESTLVIDVPNIWLMTDQTFEKHVSGSSSCWVIRSKNSAISPNVTTNGFLELTDAFGTPYIRFNKTEATFADPPSSGIYHDDQEGEWIITYETTTKPKGGANLALQGSETYPGKAILKEEGDELCPAVITWTGSSGHWLMHAKPKQIAGADPNKIFFGAVVEVEGQDYIEYLKPVSFSHLVMPNGKKIAPDVPASASVGTIVNWKVVQ